MVSRLNAEPNRFGLTAKWLWAYFVTRTAKVKEEKEKTNFMRNSIRVVHCSVGDEEIRAPMSRSELKISFGDMSGHTHTQHTQTSYWIRVSSSSPNRPDVHSCVYKDNFLLTVFLAFRCWGWRLNEPSFSVQPLGNTIWYSPEKESFLCSAAARKFDAQKTN